MGRLSERRARLLASVYATFGEAATWSPQGGGATASVTVRRRGGEDLAEFGDSEAIVGVAWLRVRVGEMADPKRNDVIEITETGEKFRVANRPRRTKTGLEWLIEPAPQA